MRVNVSVESAVSESLRARQVSSMFDAPPQSKCRIEWSLDVDLESAPWNVGLVVGPSGSGKTTFLRHFWGEPKPLEWAGAGVVDDFAKGISVETIAGVCQAVGFNTIPAWMRPHAVLSNGEKFRVELARRLLEDGDPVVVDEFTSVVDRQVAQIGSHAVQKYCRKNNRRFVAVTCHYDVIDWLQPDWVLDMATKSFTRRLLQRRPTIDCVVGRLPRSAWAMFAPYHYLTAELHQAAQCFGLWANGRLAAFAGLLHRPVSQGTDEPIWGVQRLVTLPDWQGLGLAMVLVDALGADYRAAGKRVHTYPAHPALIRTFDKSQNWKLTAKPKMRGSNNRTKTCTGTFGGRPCAVFAYCGEAAEQATLI
jgi:ABC-type lipoprotein export system ATPase subunit/GNAT superfamily N-acetyltransferase